MPGYWAGDALEWNSFLRLVSLGAAHLALLKILRRMKMTLSLAFAFSTVTVYNLRMLDLFRYGAALEAYTGFIFLCCAIAWLWLEGSSWRVSVLISAATHWLITSGHPQMSYFGVLGAGAFSLVIPFFARCMLDGEPIPFRRLAGVWGRVILWTGVGIMLAAAYLAPFYWDFVRTNAERIGDDYSWAVSYVDDLPGTLNSFFLPLRSDVHGAFGGSTLIIVAALMPAVRLLKVKLPPFFWFVWGLSLLTVLCMMGALTPVHYWMWKVFPLARAMRAPGRISFVLPMLLMVLAASGIQCASRRTAPGRKRARMDAYGFIALTAIVLCALWAIISLCRAHPASHYAPLNVRDVPSWIEGAAFVCGLVSLGALALHAFPGTRRWSGALLCAGVCAQLLSVLAYGTWIEEKRDILTFSDMSELKRMTLEYPYDPGFGLGSAVALQHLSRSAFSPLLARVYPRAIATASVNDAYARMEQGISSDEVVIEGIAENRFDDADLQIASGAYRVALVYSSYNRLTFEVVSAHPGFLVLNYPHTGRWRAWIDSREAPIYRAFGAEHGVEVPAGAVEVEFRYWSWAAVWGVAASCATVCLLGVISLLAGGKNAAQVLCGITAAIAGPVLFLLWLNSLYAGGNLRTHHIWTYEKPPLERNLAYRRRAVLSPPPKTGEDPGWGLSQGRAVDGDRTSRVFAQTDLVEDPAWTVDLHESRRIGRIVVYEPMRAVGLNVRPLIVSVCDDGDRWRDIGRIDEYGARELVHTLTFERPPTARRVRIRAEGTCRLSLCEVEIYGPEQRAPTDAAGHAR